ncbi:uncharacterized protein IL334_002928 [Kwoniella shivajii]|uniref:N-acetylglucosaminylphosphatidylinositol deacetylase n=1 Tax=Kwoniella shivajii TaxID=564305 RepID=A0ABZ1CW43_9TREE|nr:hypothetical protein IL334_002928 [Kwoniella shivajii]
MPPVKKPLTSAARPTRHFSPLFLLSLLLPLFALFYPWLSNSSSSTLRPNDLSSLLVLSRSGTTSPSVLILTAHPDDEVMFFSPTILGLTSAGWDVRGLCLSTGNSSGMGHIREKELFKSYEALGVKSYGVKVIDHPDLQDSMKSQWDVRLIASIVTEFLESEPVDLVITFDPYGISNHPNHIALSHSIAHISKSTKVLYLKSPSTLPKFTGPLYPLYLQLEGTLLNLVGSTKTKAGEHVMISNPSQWLKSVNAMMYHKTQLVWFRWLYLAASRLMWVNELIEAN